MALALSTMLGLQKFVFVGRAEGEMLAEEVALSSRSPAAAAGFSNGEIGRDGDLEQRTD